EAAVFPSSHVRTGRRTSMATTRRDFLKRAAATSAGMTALAVGADWQRASAASPYADWIAASPKPPKRGGVLTRASAWDPPVIDPRLTQSVGLFQFAGLTSNRLLRYAFAAEATGYTDLSLKGDPAESWQGSPDQRVGTCKQRLGAARRAPCRHPPGADPRGAHRPDAHPRLPRHGTPRGGPVRRAPGARLRHARGGISDGPERFLAAAEPVGGGGHPQDASSRRRAGAHAFDHAVRARAGPGQATVRRRARPPRPLDGRRPSEAGGHSVRGPRHRYRGRAVDLLPGRQADGEGPRPLVAVPSHGREEASGRGRPPQRLRDDLVLLRVLSADVVPGPARPARSEEEPQRQRQDQQA